MQLIAQVLQALELAYVYSQSSYIVVGQKAPLHDKLSLQPWKIGAVWGYKPRFSYTCMVCVQ